MCRFRYGLHKGFGHFRSGHLAQQHVLERNIFAVNGGGGIGVLLDDRAFQCQAGKSSFGTRIGEHLGIKFPVRPSGRVSSHRSGGGRSFSAHLELAGKELLHSLVIHDQHDQVNAFNADLKSPATATHGNKCGGAPAIRRATGGYSAAVLAAEYESDLYQMGDNGNAFGLGSTSSGMPLSGASAIWVKT